MAENGILYWDTSFEQKLFDLGKTRRRHWHMDPKPYGASGQTFDCRIDFQPIDVATKDTQDIFVTLQLVPMYALENIDN
jgi:hypothetical protein